jgi:hypothetical protein
MVETLLRGLWLPVLAFIVITVGILTVFFMALPSDAERIRNNQKAIEENTHVVKKMVDGELVTCVIHVDNIDCIEKGE